LKYISILNSWESKKKGENRVIIFFNKGEKTQAFHFYLPENPSTIYEKNGKKYRITLVKMDKLISSGEPFPIFEAELLES
jgi:hypothetical protein